MINRGLVFFYCNFQSRLLDEKGCFQGKRTTYPTVMTSPEFLSVTKLLAMVMITGSMICREQDNNVTPWSSMYSNCQVSLRRTSGGTSWCDAWAAHSRIFVTSAERARQLENMTTAEFNLAGSGPHLSDAAGGTAGRRGKN